MLLSDLNYDCAIYKRRIAVAVNSRPRQKKILFKKQVLCLKRAHVHVNMQMRMTDMCCKLPQEGVLSNFSSRFTCVAQ